ncbi:hypothetical protein BG74_03255, partial [Sodalis-like endosymbiont of Proechinophthirus fluctus]|uniref:hypothetical protein n=1 Tax=Sodalis-like endosymbiont of Proechinophthirus fluctus TaxID=1462730 RepID=UPI0007A7DB54
MALLPWHDDGVYRRCCAQQSHHQRRGRFLHDGVEFGGAGICTVMASRIPVRTRQAPLILVTLANHLPRVMNFFFATRLK